MASRAYSHIGLSTLDLDRTRAYPNGLMLEYAWQSRALGPDDAVMQVRARLRLRGGSPVTDFRDE